MSLLFKSYKLLNSLNRLSFKVPKYTTRNILRCYAANSYKLDLNVNNVSLDEYISKLHKEYTVLIKNTSNPSDSRLVELTPVVNILSERDKLVSNLHSLQELIDSEDKEISQLAKEERAQLEEKLTDLDDELLEALLPIDKEDTHNAIILEVQAGVGGKEAMLFAQEMFDMYCNFAKSKGWEFEIAEYLETELGGLRHGSMLINGTDVYKYFKYEAGVHRVQRVPSTEKAGRIHTSTVSVVALPQPSEIDVQIDNKDLKFETKRSSGAGGQHVNTTDSAVRLIHLPTNITVDCQVDRSQIKNRKLALARLRAILYQRELDSRRANIDATRKSQVRSNNRNEKIRTYNFNQDRITDHRLQGVHFHNLKVFLEQGSELESLIDQLDRQCRLNELLEIINDK